jgi:hypothetical protein
VLVAVLLDAWCDRDVVVRTHRHDQEVRVVGADVGLHPPGHRVDADHRFLPELDTVLRDVAVRRQHIVDRLAAGRTDQRRI